MRYYYIPKSIKEEKQQMIVQPIFLFLYEDNCYTVISPAHAHEYTEIFYITSGEGKFAFSHTSVPFKENDVFIIPKYVRHQELTVSEEISYLVVAVDNDFPFSDGAAPSTTPTWYSYASKDNVIYKCMDQIRQKLAAPSTFLEYNVTLLTSQIFTEVMQKIPAESAIPPAPSIKVVHDYISTNFQDNITLKTLASIRYTSTAQLGREFKQAYGCTPIQFLTQKRIEHAKHILRTTNATIFNVSISSGFSSPAYFSYVFLKETGETPTEYRNKNSYDFRSAKQTPPRY